MHNDMNCSHVRSILSDYVDGRLTGSQTREVQGHLAGCELCSRQATELQSLDALLARAIPCEPQRDLWGLVQERIQTRESTTSAGWLRFLFPVQWARTALAASVVAAAALALVIPLPTGAPHLPALTGGQKPSSSYGATYVAGHEMLDLGQSPLTDGASDVLLTALATQAAAGDHTGSMSMAPNAE